MISALLLIAIVCSYHFMFIGTHTVVHPTAKILAYDGPIVIGDNNLIMEQSVIINKYGRQYQSYFHNIPFYA